MKGAELKNYLSLYSSITDIRVALKNRIGPNSMRNRSVKQDAKFVDFCGHVADRLDEIERYVLENEDVGHIVISPDIEPIYRWLIANRGIKHIRACGIIACIYPISRFNSVSNLWAYAGYGVVDFCETCGKRYVQPGSREKWLTKTVGRLDDANQRRIRATKATNDELRAKAEGYLCNCRDPVIVSKGQKRFADQLPDFNPELKKQVYLCVSQFIRLKNPNLYKTYYYQCKEEYMNRPDLREQMESRARGTIKGTGRIDSMAKRKVAKLFLSHIWQIWNEIEGNEAATDAYVFDVLGHKDHIPPEIRLQDVDMKSKLKFKEINLNWDLNYGSQDVDLDDRIACDVDLE